jgi:L-ascorbate 6-phosphate lactonase
MKHIKSSAILIIAIFSVSGSPYSVGEVGAPSDPSTIAQVRSHHQGLAVWWTGNAGWLIKADDFLIGVDLDLGTQNKVERPPVLAEDLVSELDVAIVTHHHGDHCHTPTIRALAEGNRARFVLPPKCLAQVGTGLVDPERILIPNPGDPFEIGSLRVEPIHAIHGNQDFTVLTREPDFVESIARSCGYVLTLLGTRFLHPGDSVLTEQHLGLKDIDVLFISPTVHNMYIDRSMILINRLQPRFVFPQHFGTYRVNEGNAFWTRGYPDELKLRLSKDLQARYHKLAQGQKFEISPSTDPR